MYKIIDTNFNESFNDPTRKDYFKREALIIKIKFNLYKKYIITVSILIIIILKFIWKKVPVYVRNKNLLLIPCHKDSYKKKFIYFNLSQVNEFIKLCNNGTIIDSIFNIKEKPKITALIPVYNSNKYIKPAIRSIQNQNIQDIEIIIVDDFSTDNTFSIINVLQKEDPRIKIIKNNRNRGTLYTRSIGALYSKGKYIMTLDNDDIFINDIFNICYEEAENNNIDIVEFATCKAKINSLFTKNYCKLNDFIKHKEDNKVIKQPELSNFIFKKIDDKYCLIDAYLWGKIIKATVYKRALEEIGEEIYTKRVYISEDRIVDFALFRVANSFKYIEKFGIIHYDNPVSVGSLWKKRNKLNEELINIMSMYNLTKKSKDVIFPAISFQKIWKPSYLTPSSKILAKIIYDKLISNKNLDDKIKALLKNLIKNFFFNTF